MGPVIDQKAYEKVLAYIEIGKEEGKLIAGGAKAPGNGYYIEPTVFKRCGFKSTNYARRDFGPVLALTKATNWEEAIEIYNETDYGLTGAFSLKTKREFKGR